jgi:hypothetical protein
MVICPLDRIRISLGKVPYSSIYYSSYSDSQNMSDFYIFLKRNVDYPKKTLEEGQNILNNHNSDWPFIG